MRFDEHPHGRLIDEVLRRGLALRAVVPDSRRGGLHLGQGIARHHPVEFGVAQRPLGFATGADEDLGADVRAVDHGRQRHRLLRPQRRREPFEDGHWGTISLCTAFNGHTRWCLQ